MDQKILALLDKWVGAEPSNKLKKGFLGELTDGRQFSPSLDKELFFCRVVHLTFQVRLLVVGGEMRVGDDKEVSFRVGHPFC